MSALYVTTGVLAAMLCGFGFVLQQRVAQQAPSADFLRLSLIARLIHNRGWLGGIAVLIAGYLLAAWTLGHLSLSVTEPLLSTYLIFALLLAVPLSGQAVRRTEIVGAILLSAGVAALSATRSVRAPGESFGSVSHWWAAAVIAGIAVVLVQVGRWRSDTVRATLTGIASGLILGIADALTRKSVQVLDGHHPLTLLTTWQAYCTVLATLVGWWLMQNAFSVAPLHASLPAITAAEPASGIVLGVLVYGDVIHVTPLLLALQAAGIAAMIVGVVLVARAPVFSGLHLRELPHAALDRIQHPPALEDAAARPPAHPAEEPPAEPPPAEPPLAEPPLAEPPLAEPPPAEPPLAGPPAGAAAGKGLAARGTARPE
jgi:drug/metabolite transporter (DMT)-like permease